MFGGKPILGIAGGIGAGKSYVANLLGQTGCRVIASDELVRTAYTHPAVKRAIMERFGEIAFDPAGRVDRKHLANIVFRDVAQREWLEQLLHPIVNQVRLAIMEEGAKDESVLGYVWDSPLLFETKLNELCDVTIFVDADRPTRLKRVAERGWDEAELDRRENLQTPLDKKQELADYQVRNDDEQPATVDSVSSMLHRILEDLAHRSGGCCGGGCNGSTPRGEAACCANASCGNACGSSCAGSASDESAGGVTQ